jgi:two-component system response regulator YesN
MLKVIIADDEDKICQLIYKLINWEALDMNVVGIAHNGVEALELIKTFDPDIAITDIRMPGFDGLEFICKAKEFNNHIEFIIISGYQHFEYAQRAIKYGVSDYLLKPIKKDELTGTLGKMKDRYLERAEQLSNEEKLKLNLKNNMDKLRTGFFNGILFQRIKRAKDITVEMINKEYQYAFHIGCFQIIIVKLDGVEQSFYSNIKFIEEKIIHIIRNNLKEYCFDMESCFEENICYCILNYKPGNKKNIRRQCKAILDEVTSKKEIFENIDITVGLGTVEEDIRMIDNSLKAAIWAYEQRLISGTNRVIEGEIVISNQLADSKLFYEFNKIMTTALERLDKDAVVESIRFLREGLKKRTETSGHEVLQMTKEVCNLFLFTMRNYKFTIEDGETFFEDFNRDVNNYGSINTLFSYLSNTIVLSLEKVIKDKRLMDTKPIREAKQYIQDNYQLSITLEEVSTKIGFNSTYFCSLFKKDTGSTFLEYLSDIRINKAKELLKETNFSIAVICEQVGYSDVKHFTKTFIKHAGLKPNEYRKLYS